MALSKLGMNLVFAFVVTILGMVVVVSLSTPRNRPVYRPAEIPDSADGALPENHPPMDAANRLMILEQLSAKNPQNADYRTQMANIYYDLGQYEKAADFYQQSLSIRAQDPNVETDLASSFYYMGRHNEALERLNKVLEYRPSFSQAMFNKGIVLISGKKDVKGGIAVWEELLQSDPAFSREAGLEQKISQAKATIR